MNKKILVLILIPVLVLMAFTAIYRVSAANTITIGVIGPYNLAEWSPGGMQQGAHMAADEINAKGGINIGGTNYTINVLEANEWAYDPSTGSYNLPQADLSIKALLALHPQFIIGGFRTETTQLIIEDVMDYNAAHSGSEIPFFICGAATEQSDVPPTWYLCQNLTDPTTYNRYKWVFRNTPTNGTVLAMTMIDYCGMYLFPKKLLPMYGSPVKYGVLMEGYTWCDALYSTVNAPTGPYIFNAYFGIPTTVPAGCAQRVTYNPDIPVDFTSYLGACQAAGVHILLVAFTLPQLVDVLAVQAAAYHIMIVGIDTPAEEQADWSRTGGANNYIVLTNYAGSVDVFPGYPAAMVTFWNNFVAKYGVWPMYTAQGAYDSVYGIAEALHTAGAGWTPTSLLPIIKGGRSGLTGTVRYTNWQDLFETSVDESIYWPDGYARDQMVQWINGSTVTPPVSGGVMSTVSPTDQLYSRKTQIPLRMYALALWDVNFDGIVDMMDISTAARAFMATPGTSQWNMEADVNLDGIVDMMDISAMAMRFMQTAPTWPLTS